MVSALECICSSKPHFCNPPAGKETCFCIGRDLPEEEVAFVVYAVGGGGTF